MVKLNPAYQRVIAALEEAGADGLTTSALAMASKTPRSMLQSITIGLELAGMVERFRDPKSTRGYVSFCYRLKSAAA
jgi:DNA-binding IclR family transcriptional regulator